MRGECVDPTAASLTVLHSTDDLVPGPWNATVGATPSAQYGSIRTYEATNTTGVKPHYFVLGGTNRPLAVAIGYLASTTKQCERITRPLLGRARFLAPVLVDCLGPTLILGLRPMYGPALLTNGHLDGGVQRSRLHAICGEIENWADEHGRTLAVAGLTDHDQAVIDVLRQRDFDETVSHPTAELEVCWDSWEGYLRHLKHGRRKSIRREVATFASSGYRIRRLDPSEPIPSACYDLLCQHQLRKNKRTLLYHKSIFNQLRKNLPNDTIVYLAEHEGRILGFMGVVQKETAAATAYIGIAPDVRASNSFLYFNLAFYQLMRDAPGIGVERILYGTAVYKGKSLRGCKVVPTRLFIRPSRALARRLGKKAFEAHRRWCDRKFHYLYTSAPS